jgi:hypothetical protein
MNTNLDKIMAVISGKNRDDFDLGQISDADKGQLVYALDMLFSGLTLVNWLGGGKLFDAWRQSIEQMRAMIFEIKEANPVVLYLRRCVFDSNANWIKIINKSDNSNEVIQCPAESYDEWMAHAHAQISEAISIIRHKIEAFAAGQRKSVKTENQNTNSPVLEKLAREMMEDERVQSRDERTRS